MADYDSNTVFKTQFNAPEASRLFMESLDLLVRAVNEEIPASDLPAELADHFQNEDEWHEAPDKVTLLDDGEVFVSGSGPSFNLIQYALQYAMNKAGIETPQTFEWASVCSKDVAGGFGGGACAVFRDRIVEFSTCDAVRLLTGALTVDRAFLGRGIF